YDSIARCCLHSFPTRRSSDLSASNLANHINAVYELRRAYARLSADKPVRLAKTTSNLFRFRSRDDAARLDVSAFTSVISIDTERSEEHTSELQSRENLVCRLL